MTALYGTDVHLYDDGEMRAKALELVEYMKREVESWTKETGYAFSLYGTPSENLCSRFCSIDTKEFGVIDGVTDRGYYTNSFHLDVQKKVLECQTHSTHWYLRSVAPTHLIVDIAVGTSSPARHPLSVAVFDTASIKSNN